jgi:hypothetical protein
VLRLGGEELLHQRRVLVALGIKNAHAAR